MRVYHKILRDTILFSRCLLVKGRIDEIHVLFIHPILGQPQAFAEALEVDDLPGPEELDDVVDVRIIGKAKNVIVGHPGFLFCCDRVSTTFLRYRILLNDIPFWLLLSGYHKRIS